jgi:OOP family OmpA-OmpF porin
LIGQGVTNTRLHTNGMGKRNPIADNATKEGRQRNRRVEIELIPM